MGIMGETPLRVSEGLSLSSPNASPSSSAVVVTDGTERNPDRRRVPSKYRPSRLSSTGRCIGIALLLLVSSSSISSRSSSIVLLGCADASSLRSSSTNSLSAISVGLRSSVNTVFPSPISHRLFGGQTPTGNSASPSTGTGLGVGRAFSPGRRRSRSANGNGTEGSASSLRKIDSVVHRPQQASIVSDSHPDTTKPETLPLPPPTVRGGAAAAIPSPILPTRGLLFWENMICGAVSRSIAQVLTHPANTMKTILQSNRESASAAPMTMATLTRPRNLKMLTRGAGAQFVLSVPHGAINFAVLECVRSRLNGLASRSSWAREREAETAYFGPALDFLSSALATCACSVVSTPQMMILDNIMAGTYPNLVQATVGLSKDRGVMGFYTGWWPGLAGKIPSYALTWTLFQQLKRVNLRILHRTPTDIENAAMGCLASAAAVCVMIPMDTIKTRLVTQLNYPDLIPYKGIVDAAVRISREEGVRAFYRGLTPRLCSVVPMIGIQFGVYEFMKKVVVERDEVGGGVAVDRRDASGGGQSRNLLRNWKWNRQGAGLRLEEVMMEVAADDDQPFPVPHLRDYKEDKGYNEENTKSQWWKRSKATDR